MAGVRKTIERVPDGRFGWKPHEKSMTTASITEPGSASIFA